jgi:hypothetical protein
LVAAIATSPSNSVATTPQTAPAAAPGMPAIDTSAKRSLDVEYEVEEPPTKQTKPTPTKNAFDLLIDGAAVHNVDLNNITVQSELQRLYSADVFQTKKKQAAKKGEEVSKRALFDSTNEYYFGSNPDINQ